jgi:hypothetical protein
MTIPVYPGVVFPRPAQKQSYSLLVRDGVYDRVRYLEFFRDFTFSKTKALPVQTSDVPYCGIYFLNELQLPDGEAQTGEIRFRVMTRIGISIMVMNNFPEAGEAKADQALWEIETRLYSDPTFYFNDAYKIQAFTRGERTHTFGTIGQSDEPIVECQFDLTCDLGVIPWPPYLPDVLETVHVDARPLLNPNAPLIHMQWDIPVNDNGVRHVGKNARQAKPRKPPAAPGRRSIG